MSSIPQWLRETIPAWAFIGIALWFVLQRALERPPEVVGRHRSTVKPYGRPVRDPRIVCITLGLVAMSVMQIWHGPVAGSVNSGFQSLTQTFLAGLMALSGVLTVAAAITKVEWWSAGLELAGCVGLCASFLVYTAGYATTTDNWQATLGAMLAAGLLLGNALRAIQLFRRVG